MRKKHFRLTTLKFERVEDRLLLSASDATDGDFLARPGPIEGDADRNGVVDFTDFLAVARNFGREDSVWESGDFDDDGVTGFPDFLILRETFGDVAPTIDEIQAASLEDRQVASSGFAEFKAATAIPSVSPKLSEALAGDLVVRYDETLNTDGITAVVLKPRSNEVIYEIPIPAAEANIFEHLKDHFKQALREDAGQILFPPNHVFEIVPPLPTTRHLKLEGFQDVVIDLNGSTLAFTQVSTGILIEDSQRVAIQNGSIRGYGVLASIAKVVPDDTAAGIGFEVLPEYQELLASTPGLPNVVTIGKAEMSSDGWRIQSEDYKEIFVNRGQTTNNFAYDTLRGTVRAVSAFADSGVFEIGEHVWIQHQNNTAHSIVLDNETGAGIEDITLKQLRIFNVPGMQIVGEIVRGLHVDEVSIERDANDPLAFLAGASDSIHINANGGDIVIENSYLGPNLDDKITIKGNYWQVTAIDETTKELKVEPVDRGSSLTRWGYTGHRVTFITDDFGVIGNAQLVEDSIRDSSRRHFIRLDEIPEGVGIGSIVGNVDNSGGRVVIRNNVMEETRAQGVLVQTSHVVIENNRLSGIAGPAIKLNLALHKWYESINVSNVLIKDNVFSRSSRSPDKSNELIHLFQMNRCFHLVEVMDQILIVGNAIATSVEESPDSGTAEELPEQPTQEQPTQEQPTQEQPTQEQPTQEQPTQEQPVDTIPGEEVPVGVPTQPQTNPDPEDPIDGIPEEETPVGVPTQPQTNPDQEDPIDGIPEEETPVGVPTQPQTNPDPEDPIDGIPEEETPVGVPTQPQTNPDQEDPIDGIPEEETPVGVPTQPQTPTNPDPEDPIDSIPEEETPVGVPTQPQTPTNPDPEDPIDGIPEEETETPVGVPKEPPTLGVPDQGIPTSDGPAQEIPSQDIPGTSVKDVLAG